MQRLLALLLLLLLAGAANPAEAASGKPTTIVFVCLHGSVKSQVAAAHFNRIARERGLPVVAISHGIAVDNEIPTVIREGLARISHTNLAHRGAESAKVVVLQRLFAIQGERPDADRV